MSEDFIEKFEILVSLANETLEDEFIGYFLKGLRQNIRNQVRPHNLKDLIWALKIVQDVAVAMKDEQYINVPLYQEPYLGFRY